MMPDEAASEMSLKKADAILIAGPTASGKSAFALDLALRHNGVLINADSMQVYRDLRVLSARPSVEDEQRVAHFLFGHVDGAVNYSVGHWLWDVARLLPEIRESGRLPIFVGGTGLYFKALTQGLSEIPHVPQAIRAKVRAEAAGLPPEILHQRLAACDPVMAAKLRPSDPQRLLRALEVFAATGQSLDAFQHKKSPPLLAVETCEALFLAPDRDVLRKRIETRFEAMLKQGALEEVRLLAARCLDSTLPIVRAHGVPHLLKYLSGEAGLEEAAASAIAETRQYARRQFTFARHQLPAFRPINI
jgi:tRNA dimethylallyltransferase